MSSGQSLSNSSSLEDDALLLRPRRRAPLVVLALSLLLGALTLLLWNAQPRQAPQDVTDAQPAVSSAARAADTSASDLAEPRPNAAPMAGSTAGSAQPAAATEDSEPEASPVAVDPREQDDSEGTEPAASKGTVEVVVIPYGEVLVGDRSYGQAPVNVRLRPGTHTITARAPRGILNANVEVKAGKRKRVVLE
jgi:hypothetical protein